MFVHPNYTRVEAWHRGVEAVSEPDPRVDPRHYIANRLRHGSTAEHISSGTDGFSLPAIQPWQTRAILEIGRS